MGEKTKERRFYQHGQVVRMAGPVDGYVMVRRPRCMPFVMHARQWADLPLVEGDRP